MAAIRGIEEKRAPLSLFFMPEELIKAMPTSAVTPKKYRLVVEVKEKDKRSIGEMR